MEDITRLRKDMDFMIKTIVYEREKRMSKIFFITGGKGSYLQATV